MEKIKVTVWNEFVHERNDEKVAEVYPNGIHNQIAELLLESGQDFEVRTATLDMEDCGLPQSVLDNTDVLFWWGHVAHAKVPDEVVDRVQKRVLEGMGLVVLHSGHMSRIFMRLMGTSCNLKWREIGEHERVWAIEPGHPIAAGLPDNFVVPQTEMYGERFDIPAPDTLVFVSWYQGGEVFRSGCCYQRGLGRIFYFSPGHETFPIYYQNEVKKVLVNAAHWVAQPSAPAVTFGNVQPLESL